MIVDKPIDWESDMLVAPSQLAAYLKVSNSTLERWRRTGEGPPFVKLGRRIVAYQPSSIQKWLKSGEQVGYDY